MFFGQRVPARAPRPFLANDLWTGRVVVDGGGVRLPFGSPFALTREVATRLAANADRAAGDAWPLVAAGAKRGSVVPIAHYPDGGVLSAGQPSAELAHRGR